MNPDRRYDIDALRVLAFGLLILYHVGMFYVPWDWHVKSAYTASWLEPFMRFSGQWRMPLLFLISGLAVHFRLPKTRRGGFARERISRLGLPLLFGILVVVPPQAYLQAVSNGVFDGSYGAFLLRYLQFRPWPEGGFDGAEYGMTWNHLWYLPYLLLYTLFLLPFSGWLDRLSDRCAGLRGLWLLLLPLAPLMLAGEFVFPKFPYVSHALFDDVYAHAVFGTFFLCGYLIGRQALLWSTITRARWVWLLLGMLSFPAFLFANEVMDGDDAAQNAAQMFLIYLNRWVWILVVLAWGHRLLNRPMRWLPWANERVFSWYILHQTLIVVIGYTASQAALGPVVEPAVVLGGTILGTLLVTEAIRRVDGLRLLFGMRRNPGGMRVRPRLRADAAIQSSGD